MSSRSLVCLGLILLCPLLTAAEPGVPEFRVQEIEKTLKVGYAVLLTDVNGDKRPDIVVVDTNRVVWYENPTWKHRSVIEGQTRPDNVCITAADVDGDGQVEFVLGSGWKGLATDADGPLQLLRQGKTLDDPWTVHPIGGEPSVHRIRFADLDGDGKPELVVGPLLGDRSSRAKNYMDVPVRMMAYAVPADPVRDRWVPEVLDGSLHVVHNFWPVPAASGKGMDLLTASYEGVRLLQRKGDRWTVVPVGEGNQDNPNSNRGASEIKQGKLVGGEPVIATIEPWHGNQIVVYTRPRDGKGLWHRQVLDDRLKWGHGVWWADLDGDGGDELIIGVRDDLSQKPDERRGVRIFKAQDEQGAKWSRTIVESGGVAVEDLAAADLNGDGRIDVVAVGRATGNARIYWNQGKPSR